MAKRVVSASLTENTNINLHEMTVVHSFEKTLPRYHTVEELLVDSQFTIPGQGAQVCSTYAISHIPG